MGELVPANEISEEDYRAIEEAVMETARGRWFLQEYAKRNRVSDTNRVVEAINGLKSFITREHEPVDALQMRLEIVDMTQKIEQIKKEIANSGNSTPNLADASIELNVVVDETEAATSTILTSAEMIQGTAWEIRERGGLDAECDRIDEFATEIYMACSFQDLTGQRLRKVVQLTEMLEERLNAMVSLWGDEEIERYRDKPVSTDQDEHLINGPGLPDEAQGQNLIDEVMASSKGATSDDVEIDDLQWSDEEDEKLETLDPFIIDDAFSDSDVAAFTQDTVEEIAKAAVTDADFEVEDEAETPQATPSETEVENAETASHALNGWSDGDIAPLEHRVAIFN